MCNRAIVSLALLLIAASIGGCNCCPTVTPQPAGSPSNQVVQEFHGPNGTGTAWMVRFEHGPNHGLYITGAWFKRSLSDAWMKVIYDIRLAQIFVPYHAGSPRYLDLTGFGFDLIPASAADAGPCGTILEGVVIKEVRDRGVAWKDHDLVRRGQELVLWGTLNADNYNYIMEYGFRDDGTIACRLGATARNLPGDELEAHMHNGLWRIDMDLNGAAHNSALLMRHVEPAGGTSANDQMDPFNGGVEGFADRKDTEFTELAVQNTQTTNGQGHNIGYDLMPLRMGTARHLEDFTQHDFWVTQYRVGQYTYESLPSYVSAHANVTDADIVLWYISPMHHHPRDEDGMFVGRGDWVGSAQVMWSGFDLRPRNLFDRTPLYPY